MDGSAQELEPSEQPVDKREALARQTELAIQSLDRSIFHQELLKVMMGAPTVEAIQAYAERQPDRYYQSLAVVARLAGYSERPEDGASLVHGFAAIPGLSDAELLERLASMDRALQQIAAGRSLPPATIDADVVEGIDDLL